MKITGAELFILTLPTRRPHTWASNTRVPIGRHALLRLDTDEGISGWGEAPAMATWGGAGMRYYGETPETVRHIVSDYLLPAVTGLSPLDISVLHKRMDEVVKGHPYAKAAVDMAAYDAAGHALGEPVWALLGGKHRDGIELAHSLGLLPIEECVEEAERAVAEGARTIKIKTGRDGRRDVDVVRRIRAAVGPDIKIRVDANEGYASVNEAVRITREQEEFDLLLCEQPMAGADALARVASAVSTPVMADESAWTVLDILELHAKRAAECFSCYVTKPGGLYRARQQAEIADALGMYCDIGGSIEMGIGNAANLHLGAAMPNAWLPSVCPVTSVAGSSAGATAGVYYPEDIVTEPFGFADGLVLVPEGPGLGVTVDVERVKALAES